MIQELFLPTLPHWTYENPWSGSYQKVRYFITVSDGAMHADLWDQDISREFAEVKVHGDFELTPLIWPRARRSWGPCPRALSFLSGRCSREERWPR